MKLAVVLTIKLRQKIDDELIKGEVHDGAGATIRQRKQKSTNEWGDPLFIGNPKG